MTRCILAIDQGTTNTKALLIDRAGTILCQGSVPTPVHYPRPGWVEQDPEEIWRCTLGAIEASLAEAALSAEEIVAIGISNQRETTLLWDRQTGEPAGPAVVWQCHRSAPFCRRLRAQGHEPLLRHRTGLQVDPMFSGSKLRWLLDHAEDGAARAAAGRLCAGNVDAWLLWRLTGGAGMGAAVHATDATNASRTQLMGLDAVDWDADVLELFDIPREVLPEIRPSSGHFGQTVALTLPGGSSLPAGIPIAAMLGDSHASLYGLGGFRPGSVKATYGTGTSLMTPTTDVVQSTHGLSSTVAWAIGRTERSAQDRLQGQGHDSRFTIQSEQDEGGPIGSPVDAALNGESSIVSHMTGAALVDSTVVYALEGNIYTTGGAVQYIGELLGLAAPASEIEALARSVGTTSGVTFVPALVGLGAPYWQDAAQGTITGLTLGTGRAHLARAALEAIAFQVRDIFDVMQTETGADLGTLLADGGASRNDLLMQFQADILGCPVERSRSSVVSSLGAAYLAGLAIGFWTDEEDLAGLLPARDRFEPMMAVADREAAYSRWQRAVQRTLYEG